MPKPEVSVIVVVYNEGEHIGKCIESVLDQSFGDLELILVDANSTDSTPEIIGGFSDRRIRYFRLKKRVNIPESRNIGLEKARGDYIFFTDADCTADRDWIMEGLGVLKREGVVGCEGNTVYVAKGYRPGLSEKVLEGSKGFYLTSNIAYRKSVFEKTGPFDECLDAGEDLDIGIKASRLGDIPFLENMLVIHNKEEYGMVNFLKRAVLLDNVIRVVERNGRSCLSRKNGFPFYNMGRVIFPLWLILMLFPPAIIIFFINTGRRVRKGKDIAMVPLYYLRTIFMRVVIWKHSLKNRSFFI